MTQPQLHHSKRLCREWKNTSFWSLTSQGGAIVLSSDPGGLRGVWEDGDWPQCPDCGSALLVEFGDELIKPEDWFSKVAVTAYPKTEGKQ